jgi:DNA mismatch endonuclease (patch repair protein)
VDQVSSERRSANMAAIKGKNTGPELAVRKALHAAGFRFRLHRPDLPGKPDLVLPKYGTAVFVHGCFWHKHKYCPNARIPKTNIKFWVRKLDANALRDIKNKRRLEELGWRVYVVWECELKMKSQKWLFDLKQFLN